MRFRDSWVLNHDHVTCLTKRLTAKNEQEATEAHLTETKMQVAATDEAENAKNRLHQSS
ncbi:unnamed protein product [Eruca vesicaria subsp. sativa]|uniref:Uncharacterized protein n=1 Tax=Eruca vesicaria subsp. sativa TaxID=29727 RepID=A0ABC8LUP3_ERUVS|nr:unnamed protein product [Eruca vesicaria subsp. sativa]